MMNIIAIRHGETDLNKEKRLQGAREPDLPLNETGYKEIENLRETLFLIPSKIYCSPLLRTRQSADIVNKRFSVPIIYDGNLKERDFGSLTGKLRSEVGPIILANDLEGRYDYRPFGGESIDDVTDRVTNFLRTLPLETQQTVFVVTHRGIIRLLGELYPDQMPPNNPAAIPGSQHVFVISQLPAERKQEG